MKNCTKHFWREKARAPVNVCPFRNRLFCIRSDIHCVTWTKTIQTGERVLQMPLVPIKGSILCPVRAYKKMCKLIPSSDESPLFVLSNNKIVSYNMFQRKLRFLLQKAGLDSAKYSTHSFRRGSTTLLFRAEVPADQIQLMGDWRSDAYKKYLSYDLSDKIKISKVMSKFINSS